jgi:hypothetical protein
MKKIVILCCTGLLTATNAFAASVEPEITSKSTQESPWLAVPIVSSDPKLGTSGGLMAAYLFRIDPTSSVSMVGAQLLYTTTGSKVGGIFARTNFGEDRHRLTAFFGGGKIKNDYEDFLGTGFPLQTEDQLRALAGRYLYAVRDHWYVGAQATNTNYAIVTDNALAGEILEKLGLTGFDSVGIGAVINYDTRNNQNSPTSGMIVDLNNIAYRKGFGGDESFDVYRLGLKHYLPHGQGHVFVTRLNNHWTSGAPPGGYATVQLRGYTGGQYLAPHMSSIEVEERYRLGERWGLTAFTGVACLYGGKNNCGDQSSIYPTIGGGFFFMVKPNDGMVATLEYADGEGSNRGIYLRFGWGI